MALTIADRVRETTTTTGTGTITLGGAVGNFETFTANLSDGDTTYYAIVDANNSDFEVGLGTFTASGTTALTDFADATFSNVTVTARGALIFNESASGDPAVCVLDFGADKTATAGDFTVVFPTADSSNAIIRIA